MSRWVKCEFVGNTIPIFPECEAKLRTCYLLVGLARPSHFVAGDECASCPIPALVAALRTVPEHYMGNPSADLMNPLAVDAATWRQWLARRDEVLRRIELLKAETKSAPWRKK